MNIETTIPPKRRRKKASKEERRRQLIEATIATIAAKGISGATTTDVTRAAGLSAGIISLHFDGKEQLLTETLRFLAEEHREVWVAAYADPNRSPVEKLRAVIDANFDPKICTPEKISAWFAYFGEAKYRRVYLDLVKQFDAERADALTELCRTIRDEGQYKTVNPASIATFIESLADGLWLGLALYPDWSTPEELRLRIYEMLSAHFPQHFSLEETARKAS